METQARNQRTQSLRLVIQTFAVNEQERSDTVVDLRTDVGGAESPRCLGREMARSAWIERNT